MPAERGWTIDAEQLDDRHIIRRMVLKRLRVRRGQKTRWRWKLAKVSLWLHTFTVGAPLSFLDHHLRCGNSFVRLLGASRHREDERRWAWAVYPRAGEPGPRTRPTPCRRLSI